MYDVYLLALEFLDHGLHARALHAHAGAHWVYVWVVRDNGYLCPLAGLPCRGLDLHDALVYLGHLHLEEFYEEGGLRPREDYLRALGVVADVYDERADPVALAVSLAADLFLLAEQGLCTAYVHYYITTLEPLHYPGDYLAHLVAELFEDYVALGFAHLLDDYLLGSLRVDASEFFRIELYAEHVAEDALGVELAGILKGYLEVRVFHFLDNCLEEKELYLAALFLVMGLYVLVGPEALLSGLQYRRLQGVDEDLFGYTLVSSDLVYEMGKVNRH